MVDSIDTMDTVAAAGLSGSVHIIPLGHEIDRAVAPFRDIRTDAVHLLTIVSRGRHDREMFERQEEFTRRVEEELAKLQIPVDVWDVDLFNMHDVLKYVSGLITLERKRGRRVSVNASACGRLTSIGTAMAGMAHGAEVYMSRRTGIPRARRRSASTGNPSATDPQPASSTRSDSSYRGSRRRGCSPTWRR